MVGGFVRGEQVWCLVQRHANRFSLARNRNRQFVPANYGSSIGLSPGSCVFSLVRLRMGRTIRIVRVDAVRPNSIGVMAEVIRSNAANDQLRPRVVLASSFIGSGLVDGFIRLCMGRTIRIVRVEAIRPNSTGVMAEVIWSNAANDQLRLRVVQYGIQVVRSVRVDVFRPNSIGVMADIIRSNFTKRLFPGISCRWSEAVHVVRVGSARSNS